MNRMHLRSFGFSVSNSTSKVTLSTPSFMGRFCWKSLVLMRMGEVFPVQTDLSNCQLKKALSME